MSLEIVVEERPDEIVVAALGRLDAHEAPAIAAVFEGLLGDGKASFAMDLSRTVFIDSTGLAELVRVMKRAREAGGDLTLRSPSESVAVILELTAFDRAFVIERPLVENK